ncbi:YccF domain-containing protein [Chitinophaga nivalis]|uniref:YccF domain-containing protein n=1 Tax=Chitinophaga nivalis TaxID=2991709 RepID=A0ABT3IN68_9BACT|nr:YccF domain-containing protein [Chitinophaga nivalis]MCW3464891.1 YccF domain-containing protein [Chitinophaga nivalis]MCW3485418.1 YccF domain-containing protein [Chitinophaga nivalis]
MNLIGNVIWLIFGGFFAFLGYMVSGLLMCLTIIGIPFGLQCFKIGLFTLMPFGSQVRDVPGPTGCLATIFNIIWIFTGGLWVALNHLFWGFMLAITIIGIPFARQHFKLMSLTFAPFGKEIY